MTIWTNIIKRFKAPALPVATRTYDAQYFDKLLSILRIYFNQLDNLLERIVDASSTTVPVSIGGTNVDAFGRLRTSAPYTLFDSQNRYEKNDLWSESLLPSPGPGTATVTYNANKSTVELNVTTTAGSEAIRQTYRSFSYQPGKSLLVMNTFVMPAVTADIRIRIGYFNTQNGVFFQRNDSTLSFVLRSNSIPTPGTPNDDRTVTQANWNGDKLDGTGLSGYTLDSTKAQILWMDFEWLGVGSVRCGFIINGEYIVCHTFQNANNLTDVYMTTAILPVRYEIKNSGATAATLKQICSTVISEGGYEKQVATYVARMTSFNPNISTSFVPLVSIQLAPGRTGAVVVPDGFDVLPTSTSSATFEIVLIKNATLTGPVSWGSTGSNNVQADFAATGLTGGTIIKSEYILSSNLSRGQASGNSDYNWDLQIGAALDGTSDKYTIAARVLSGTHSAIGSLSFWDLT